MNFPEDNYPFLKGGGEMGALTRNFNWAATKLGNPGQWPQSLRTIVSVVLRSKFPMFLWWGADLIQFYNDAYRPSMGNNGKHPDALGKCGKDTWAEIWPVIKPLIDQVLEDGESTWSEDQLIPIYRNGRLEDVYWTFSYTAVPDETGIPAGVLVTCTETTEKVNNLAQLTESKDQLYFAIETAELGTFDYNLSTGRFVANNRFKNWIGLDTPIEMDLQMAINAIAERDRDRVKRTIHKALSQESEGIYDIEFVIENPELKTEILIHAKGRAFFNEQKTAHRLTGTLQDITQQSIDRKKIEENERNLRLIILKAPVAIAILRGPDYTVEIVNERALELWGRTEQEVQDIPILHSMPELNEQGIKELLDDVYHNERPFSATELPVNILRNGKIEPLYINFSYEPLRDIHDKVNGILAVGIDVTGQVKARQAIEHSEQKIRSMINAAPFPISVYTGEDMIVEMANQSIIDIWGKGPAVIGLPYKEVSPNAFNGKILQQLDDVLKSGLSFHRNNELVELLYNGTANRHYFNYSFTPLIDASGTVYGVMNTSNDVTEVNLAKQETEQALEQLSKISRRLEIALDAGELGSYDLDLTTGTILSSARCRANFGLADDNAFSYEKLLSIIIPEDREQMEAAVAHALENNTVYNAGYRVRWEDGSLHWVSASGLPEYDEAGQPVRMIGVTIDITRQKLFEEELAHQVATRTLELEHKNGELKRMNGELQSFAYVASHDLQEPLRKIQTFVDLIFTKEKESLTGTARDFFERIRRAASRMQLLIEDLLVYSRMNNVDQSFETTDLNELVDEVVSETKELLSAGNARVEIAALGAVRIIPFQFKQVFQNLLSNAIKFADKDRPLVVKLSKSMVHGAIAGYAYPDCDQFHQLVIEDNGIGFESQYENRIFDLFQRLHSNVEYTGTGIGLAIVKKIVENHNGLIIAKGQPGQGAKFEIYLPANC